LYNTVGDLGSTFAEAISLRAVEVQHALFEHRILTGTSIDPEVLRLPPLSFSQDEADILLRGLEDVLQ
jgi:4-aminobutyrate aminotransferase-like enzyme